jgi:hypothetical protein
LAEKAKPVTGTTRVTSTAYSAADPKDRLKVVSFLEQRGRYPAPGDGEPYKALKRMERANLTMQATATAMAGESKQSVAWRKRTARKMLARLVRPSIPRVARPREAAPASGRRRSDSGGGARQGDSGDSDPDEPEPPDVARPKGRASRRGGSAR